MGVKKIVLAVVTIITAALLLAGCGTQSAQNTNGAAEAKAEKKEITVGVTPGSSEQIMEVVAKEAAKDGLTVHVRTFSDYITPNQALATGEIDLNAFQHQPFLDAFNEKNGRQIVK